MLVWGVEASELSALAGCFPCYDAWTKVSCQQPDLLLTNAMAVIESEEVPQLPPRLHALDQARRLGNTLAGIPGTPVTGVDPHCLAVPSSSMAPPAPTPSTGRTARTSAGNGRRHTRKKEFQMLPTRARCEVETSSIKLRAAKNNYSLTHWWNNLFVVSYGLI